MEARGFAGCMGGAELSVSGGTTPGGCLCPAAQHIALVAATQRDIPALAACPWAGGDSARVQSSCQEPARMRGFGVVVARGPELWAHL